MADENKQRHCPRCGQVGIRTETDEAIQYTCPTGSHGVIWLEKKAPVEPEAEESTIEASKLNVIGEGETGDKLEPELEEPELSGEKPEPRPLN